MNPKRTGTLSHSGQTAFVLLVGLATVGLTHSVYVSVNADDSPANPELSENEAKALALRVHSEASAMDKLPRFQYRVETGNGDIETMLDIEECSLPLLRKALDEPVSKKRWFQCEETLAWSDRQALFSMREMKYKSETDESKARTGRHDRVLTASDAFERSESDGSPTQFVFLQKPDRACEGHFNSLAYFRVTPHRFWWGSSNDRQDSISSVPPERTKYRFVSREQFDDELCDVVESPSRPERLWIGRVSGRLRGVLTYWWLGAGPTEPFYESEQVRKIAGRSFATLKEYQDWHKGISPKESVELAIASNEKYFGSLSPNELIRFRDYREIAPGVWIPFREDRVWTHSSEKSRTRRKYIHLWAAVQDLKTDVDLSEIIETLQPKEGEQIQDQRFGVVINYKFRRERTQAELLEMVDAGRQKLADNAAIIRQLLAPIDELVGK